MSNHAPAAAHEHCKASSSCDSGQGRCPAASCSYLELDGGHAQPLGAPVKGLGDGGGARGGLQGPSRLAAQDWPAVGGPADLEFWKPAASQLTVLAGDLRPAQLTARANDMRPAARTCTCGPRPPHLPSVAEQTLSSTAAVTSTRTTRTPGMLPSNLQQMQDA